MYNFIILISYFIIVNCYDYCNISKYHIACNNTGNINEPCTSKARIISLSPAVKEYIVSLHNTKRNMIAIGNFNKFLPASRMATMQWDDELAYLAELNVKSCKFKDDISHDTTRFHYSGQNIEIWWGNNNIFPHDAATNAVENWFNEYHYVDMSIINSFSIITREIGHFTIMVSDRNTKLGCAMLMTSVGLKYIFTCNYARDNILRQPVYITGTPTSRCRTGINPNYTGLCSINEIIDPNVLF